MKKIITVIFAWVSILGFLGLCGYLGVQYFDSTGESLSDFQETFQEELQILEPNASFETLSRQSTEAFLALAQNNSAIIETVLTNAEGRTLALVSRIPVDGNYRETLSRDLISYREFELQANGNQWNLSAMVRVLEENQLFEALKVLGYTLGGILVFALILLFLPDERQKSSSISDVSAAQPSSFEPNFHSSPGADSSQTPSPQKPAETGTPTEPTNASSAEPTPPSPQKSTEAVAPSEPSAPSSATPTTPSTSLSPTSSQGTVGANKPYVPSTPISKPFKFISDPSNLPEEEKEETRPSEDAPKRELDSHLEKPGSRPKPEGVFTPNGLSWGDFLLQRADSELSRAGAFSNDLSLAVFFNDELSDEQIKSKVSEHVLEFFSYPDMCFEGEDNLIWVMIPNQDLDKALRTVEEFLAKLSSRSLPSLYSGVSSRSGRLISGSRICEEAKSALDKALGSMDRVVGFKADAERFRKHLAN